MNTNSEGSLHKTEVMT